MLKWLKSWCPRNTWYINEISLENAYKIPDILEIHLRYVWGMPEIYLSSTKIYLIYTYTQDIPLIYQRYNWDIPNMCLRFTWNSKNLSVIYPKYIWDKPVIYLRYTRYIHGTYMRYIRDIPEIYQPIYKPISLSS